MSAVKGVKVTALVTAAGSGNRMGAGDGKPFISLGGKPILIRALENFDASPVIDDIVVTVKRKYVEKAEGLISEYGIKKVRAVVAGDKTRTGSVSNGIDAIDGAENDIVMIHDGVRPFVTENMLREAAERAAADGAVVAAVPCTATIKEVDASGAVTGTPDRSALWEAQTPQAFRLGIIKKAYAAFDGGKATDDAALVERLGNKVSVVMGDKRNIKVTVPEDLEMAETILASMERGAGQEQDRDQGSGQG